MSYYGQYPTYNPFTGQSRGFNPFTASRPAHPFQAPVPFSLPAQPQPQRAASPFDINALGGEVPYRRYDDRPRHTLDEYEAEEQAALAHLRVIQQRRAAAEAEAAREAQIQANAARLARLEAQIEAQRAREARERELAKERERRAIEQELERQRQKRLEQEREAERQRAESRAQWQRNLAVLKQRAIQHAQAQAAAYAERQKAAAVQYARQQAQVQAQRARQACRAACARNAAANQSSNEKSEGNDFDAINSLLGGLFGINLVQDDDEGQENRDTKEKTESKEVPATAAPEQKTGNTAQHVTFAPDPAEAPLPADNKTTLEKGDKPEAKTEDSPAFPTEINDLLSQFLGLRVEPTTNGEQPRGESKPDVVSGLNKLLSQFGLEFEPDTVSTSQAPAEASTSAAPAPAEKTETPAQATSSEGERTTPITSFLNGRYDIPPFVRDILSNVEVALTQGQDVNLNTNEPVVEGKGKGVAEGEKAAKSTPAPVQHSESATPAESDDTTSSTESISKLDSISHELYLATESFTFPSHLTFSQGTDEAPQLLFNKTNSGYHAQAHKLLQLLLQADGIPSGGDKDVRRKRKEVVKAVEGAIEALEQKRDEKWKQVREKRERGEEESEDEWAHASSITTSPTPSVHGDEPVEHLEVTPEAIEHAEEYDEEKLESQAGANEKEEETAQPVNAEAEEPHSVVFDEKDEEKQAEQEEKVPSRAASVHDEEEEQGYEVL